MSTTREDFEAWANKRGLSLRPSPSLTYYSSFTAIADEAWRACESRMQAEIRAARVAGMREAAEVCERQETQDCDGQLNIYKECASATRAYADAIEQEAKS